MCHPNVNPDRRARAVIGGHPLVKLGREPASVATQIVSTLDVWFGTRDKARHKAGAKGEPESNHHGDKLELSSLKRHVQLAFCAHHVNRFFLFSIFKRMVTKPLAENGAHQRLSFASVPPKNPILISIVEISTDSLPYPPRPVPTTAELWNARHEKRVMLQ